MQPLATMPAAARRAARGVLADLDDTITTHGVLTPEAYAALARLRAAGLLVIPITGRPAGWCDHIARMWPVDAVVGENGAFYMRYDAPRRKLVKRFVVDARERAANRARLDAIGAKILRAVPGAALASDQLYREGDLAVDFCEDVAPLPRADVDRIVAMMEAEGMTAKVSSIHVNGWFGSFDKRTTALAMLGRRFALAEADILACCAFAGDSPNDAPMFAHFPLSVGVANVRDYIDRIAAPPAFVTPSRGGAGFVELADRLLALRA